LDFGGEEQKRQRDKQTQIEIARNGNRSITMTGLAKSASFEVFQP